MAAAQDTHQASQETELFAPPADFAAAAHVPSFEAYQELHRRSLEDPEGFWREITDGFTWFKPWTQLQEGEPPFVKWFVDGETNISANCLDRHVEAGRGDKVAYYWEGEPGDTRVITYADLLLDVQRFANGLKAQGLESGDRVVLYMPMVPELPVAMLACARLGVVHSVVFGGFSADAIRDRVNDAGARMIITADGGWRRGRVIPLKANVDAALADDTCPSVESVIVLKRCENEIAWRRRARHLVGRRNRRPVRRLPARAPARRAPALHPVHQRNDREAKGRGACPGRLHGLYGPDVKAGL